MRNVTLIPTYMSAKDHLPSVSESILPVIFGYQ